MKIKKSESFHDKNRILQYILSGVTTSRQIVVGPFLSRCPLPACLPAYSNWSSKVLCVPLRHECRNSFLINSIVYHHCDDISLFNWHRLEGSRVAHPLTLTVSVQREKQLITFSDCVLSRRCMHGSRGALE